MKKIISYIFLIALVLMPFKVCAEEYKEKVLIPVNTKATVKTEKFDYNGFMYNTNVDSKGNSTITFDSVKNNNITKTPISIDLLLFDSEQKNIGRVNYCTDMDISSNYAGFKLEGEQTAPFSIYVVPKYFVDGKKTSDVKYISVYDDNKYCHTGGFSNYEGLTIDEIVNGVNNNKVSEIQKFIVYINENHLQNYIIYGLVGIVILVIFGMILNALHNKMYGKTTALSYIPGINLYIAVKMAFGKIVGFIYLILLISSIVLIFLGIPILLYIVGGLAILALLIDIIKIVTKKYDMFCLEPSMKASNIKFGSDATVTNVGDQALDLNYDDEGIDNNDLTLDDEIVSRPIDDIKNSNNNTDSVDTSNDSNDDGESDLKKFFN